MRKGVSRLAKSKVMPTPEQKRNFDRMRSGQSTLAVVKPLPKLRPKGAVVTTQEMMKWQDEMERWRVETNHKLGGGAG